MLVHYRAVRLLCLQSEGEKSVQLSCKHCFHDLCIRGWTVVGKKDVCPTCNEKVDMRALNADKPWETNNLSW
jgi:RING finger protein 121/175